MGFFESSFQFVELIRRKRRSVPPMLLLGVIWVLIEDNKYPVSKDESNHRVQMI